VARDLSKNISGDGSLKRISIKDVSSSQLPAGDSYQIRPKDLVEIHLAEVFDRCCIEVDPRGMIEVPFIEGDVYANGKTVSELTADLVAVFKRYRKQPQVLVRVYRGDLRPK
jgi:protein involved in polysaccharide export with SLBB domain